MAEHVQPQTITAVTLTRRRPTLVQRAIRSVKAQRTGHPVHHVVLVDDCPDTMATLGPLADRWPNTEIRYMTRQPHEVSGPGRSSRLRNWSARHAASQWIAFLDDDNEWLPDHLDLLVRCAVQHGVRAAHSHVLLMHRDGTPYLEPLWPWAHDAAEARAIYRDYVAKGICSPGSNIVGDRPGFFDEPVDTSAWLLARTLLLQVPFRDDFSASDADNRIGEDDKLFWALVGRREPIACSRAATLKYYLGGYSNNPQGRTDDSFSWATTAEHRTADGQAG
jgi:glycosyltransferase involved in cell wall biosynthesis